MKLRRAPVRPSWKPLYDASRRPHRKLVSLPERRLLERAAGKRPLIENAHPFEAYDYLRGPGGAVIRMRRNLFACSAVQSRERK